MTTNPVDPIGLLERWEAHRRFLRWRKAQHQAQAQTLAVLARVRQSVKA